MVSKTDKNAMRQKRHVRVRGKISGTPERPRLNVYRSNANIYAQLIDDVNGTTLASASTLDKGFEGAAGNCEAAKKVGLALAGQAKKKGITTWSLTAAVMSITAVWPPWLRAPAKAAWSSKEEEEKWLTTSRMRTTPRNSLRRLST